MEILKFKTMKKIKLNNQWEVQHLEKKIKA
jgi:hypothetical protein